MNAETFSLPEYLGNVRDVWKTAGNATGRDAPVTIIHIQDAHCNYEAQHQIAKILEYVQKNYGVKTINLEGGAKGYDLSPLTSIAEAEVREKVADYFVKNGRVNGAEYFAANNPDKVNLWGIEDTLLYVENLAIYRESLEHKREVEQALTTLSSILTQLKIKHYTKDLLELDAKYIQYKASNLDFKDYLSYLIAKAKEKDIDLKAFTAIYLLNQTLDAETKIDFKKTGIERDEITKLLQKKLSPAALKELARKTADFYAGRLSQKNYYIYLINTAKPVSIDIASYPELQKYIAYISMYTAIDKMRIMEEIGELETKLKGTMFENDTQRQMDTLSKNLTLLKNIFNISLTKDDYKYYLANKDSFSMRHYTAFINKMAPLDKISAILDKNIGRLDTFRDSIAKFYSYSTERDAAFLKNMRLEALPGSQGKIAVMITGGFHAENLRELFRTNNINYVSITPTFKSEEGYQSPYYDLLGGKETHIEKLIDSAMSTMQIYDYLTELGVAIDGQAAKNRFLDSVKILTILQAKGTCVIRNAKYNEFITFTAEKDEAGNITKITYTITRSRKDAADATKPDLDKEPYDLTAQGGPLLYQTQAEHINPMIERAFKDKNIKEVDANDVEAVASYIQNKLGRKDIADQLRAFAQAGFVNLIWGDYVKGFYGGVGLGLKEPGKAPTGGIYINRNKHLNADGTVNRKAVRSTLIREAMAYFFNKGDAFNGEVQEAFMAGQDAIGLRMKLQGVTPQPFALRNIQELMTNPGNYVAESGATPSEAALDSIDIDRSTDGAFMGKYLMTGQPRYTDLGNDEWLITITAKDMQNNTEKTIELRARRLDIRYAVHALKDLQRGPYSAAVKTIVGWLTKEVADKKPWRFFAFTDAAQMAEAGIYGMGLPGVIAVPGEIATNPAAVFHEAAHALFLSASPAYRQQLLATLIGPAVTPTADVSAVDYQRACAQREVLFTMFMDYLAANRSLMPEATRKAFNACNGTDVRKVARANATPASRERAAALFDAFIAAARADGWDNTLIHYALRAIQNSEMRDANNVVSDIVDPLQERWRTPLDWEQGVIGFLRNAATPKDFFRAAKNPNPADLDRLTADRLQLTGLTPLGGDAGRNKTVFTGTASDGTQWFVKYGSFGAFADHTALLVWLKEWRITEMLRDKPLGHGTIVGNDPAAFLRATGQADAADALEKAWAARDWAGLLKVVKEHFVVNGSLCTAAPLLKNGQFLNKVLVDQHARITELFAQDANNPDGKAARSRFLAQHDEIYTLINKLTVEMHRRGIVHGDIKPANIFIHFEDPADPEKPTRASYIDPETAGIIEHDASGAYRYSKFLHGITTRLYGHLYNNRRDEYEKLRGKEIADFLIARDNFSVAAIKFVLKNPLFKEPLIDPIAPSDARNFWDLLSRNPREAFPLRIAGGTAFSLALKQAIKVRLNLLHRERETLDRTARGGREDAVAMAARGAGTELRTPPATAELQAYDAALRLSEGAKAFYRLNRLIANVTEALERAASPDIAGNPQLLTQTLEQAVTLLRSIGRERLLIRDAAQAAYDDVRNMVITSDTDSLNLGMRALSDAVDTIGIQEAAEKRLAQTLAGITNKKDGSIPALLARIGELSRSPDANALDAAEAQLILDDIHALYDALRAEVLTAGNEAELERIRKKFSVVDKELAKRAHQDAHAWGNPVIGTVAEPVAGAMGRYEIVSQPVFTLTPGSTDAGAITMEVRDMTPDAAGVRNTATVTLPARRIDRAGMQRTLGALRGRSPQSDRIIGWANTQAWDAYVLTDESVMAAEGVFGIGMPGFIAVPESLQANPAALFHEIGHAAIQAKVISTASLLASSPDVEERLAGYMADGEGRDAFPDHYGLRAFAEVFLTREDREVGAEIARIQKKSLRAARTGSQDAYIEALTAMGTFTSTQVAEIAKAKPLYDTLREAVPMILAIMNRDTKTYDLSPAPLEDAAKTVAIGNDTERKLQKNGLGVYADTYRFGNGENWFANLTAKVDGMLKDFAEAVKNKETTARFIIRLMGDAKNRDALQQHIARRLGEMGYEGDVTAEIQRRIRVVTVDIADAKHLNPVPDLITDILAMEYDRYLQQDYPGGEASDELLLQLARALNVTTENLRLDPLKKDEFRTVLMNLFNGTELLRIRAIDWKTIDEWKKGQDAVLQAV